MTTPHATLREIVLELARATMPDTVSVQAFYDEVENRVQFDSDDLNPVQNERVNEPNWKRNTRNVLQASKRRLELVNVAKDQWRMPTPDKDRSVDISTVWDLVRVAAIRSHDGGEVFRSTIQEVQYRVRRIDADGIELERLDANAPEQLTKEEVERCIAHLNAAGGSLARRHLHYTVAKEVALVHLHPRLRWTSDGAQIEIAPEKKARSGSRSFGEIQGVEPGKQFSSRAELAAAGVHRPLVAGISGSQSEGADSIVISGGYEDDEDCGDVIVYTGHGGNDPNTGRQIGDQEVSAQHNRT